MNQLKTINMTNKRKKELMEMEIEEINAMFERLYAERNRLHSELLCVVDVEKVLSPIELISMDWEHDEAIGVRNNAELYEVGGDATARIEELANNVAIYEDYLVENYDDVLDSREEIKMESKEINNVLRVFAYWRVAEKLLGCLSSLIHYRNGGEVDC